MVVMDPNRGKAKQIDEKSWEQVYNDFPLSVMFMNDNIPRLATPMVHSYLLAKPKPRPTLLEKCRGKGGPVPQMGRYAWDDWARNRGKTRIKTKKEKVKEKNQHRLPRHCTIFLSCGQPSF